MTDNLLLLHNQQSYRNLNSMSKLSTKTLHILFGMALSDRIIEAREDAGLSQADVARLWSVTRATVHLLENGTTQTIRPEYLFKLAERTKFRPEYIALDQLPKMAVNASERLSGDEVSLLELWRNTPLDRRQKATWVMLMGDSST